VLVFQHARKGRSRDRNKLRFPFRALTIQVSALAELRDEIHATQFSRIAKRDIQARDTVRHLVVVDVFHKPPKRRRERL